MRRRLSSAGFARPVLATGFGRPGRVLARPEHTAVVESIGSSLVLCRSTFSARLRPAARVPPDSLGLDGEAHP